jgi:type I restriction enzyme, S subunit
MTVQEWPLVPLGMLCRWVASGGTPLRSVPDYYVGGTIPWLKTGEVKKSFVYETEEFITERGLENSSTKLIPPNSLIVAMYGDGDTAGNVAINKIPLTTNQACCNFVVDDAKADYRYLYYYLKGSYANLVGLKVGGSQQNLNSQTLRRFPIAVPLVATQRRIAAILSTYDDLIANNQRRIALLESMAEEIYREWFVRNRPAGAVTVEARGAARERWTTHTLPEVASITYGFTFAGERFNTAALGKPIIRIRDVLSGTTDDFTDEVVNDKYLVRAGDLLIGMDGEFHMNHWVGDEAYLVQRVCRVEARDNRLRAYLSHALRAPIRYYQETIVGATVGHLGAKHLNAIQIAVPDAGFLPNLERLNELLDMKLTLAKQSLALARSRDALLPRLISGKLKVHHLDIQLPPAMRQHVTD